jgi:hypothetical protein
MMGPGSAIGTALEFVRRQWWLVLGVSALVVAPCLWHPHIEAGDLGSHVYNAWLAQLIGRSQAPGLYLARQWNNILFDVSLLHVANLVGFPAAEKIAVAGCVLISFWGVFAFVGVVSGRSPWLLTPCIAMLAYGYSFSMGFMNYCLSIGLGCFCLALVWPRNSQMNSPSQEKDRVKDWAAALVVGGITWMAHPLGFLWAVATIAYVALHRALPSWWKATVPAGAVAALAAVRWYLHRRTDLTVDWQGSLPFWQLNGADQLMVYGDRYAVLAWAAVVFGIVCFLAAAVTHRGNGAWWKALVLPAELYFVAFLATATLPENLRVSLYAAWIGLLVSRLTTISAVLGLCVLGSASLRKWGFAGFAGLAAWYFLFFYLDTQTLNRMEANTGKLVSALPVGTRIIPTLAADPNWRVEFVSHVVDRACVGRCFVYSNYEPSSKQFRVRVAPGGSWIVTDSAENADDMQGGGYEIQKGDLPLKQLYQCGRGDWTRVCLRDLAEGEDTGKFAWRPGG